MNPNLLITILLLKFSDEKMLSNENNQKTQNSQNINKNENGEGKEREAKQKDDQKQQTIQNSNLLSKTKFIQVYNY